MLLKRIVITAVVASLGLLTAACSDDSKDACEHVNEVCASQQGFQKQDCSKVNDEYDKGTDAEKEKADKAIDCIMDADTCADIIKCSTSAGSSSSSG